MKGGGWHLRHASVPLRPPSGPTFGSVSTVERGAADARTTKQKSDLRSLRFRSTARKIRVTYCKQQPLSRVETYCTRFVSDGRALFIAYSSRAIVVRKKVYSS